MKTAVAFLVCALAASAQGMVRSNSVFYQLLSGAKMSDEQMSMMMAEIEDESNEQGCQGTAVYQITVDFLWSAVTHPTDYPAGSANWSPVAGTTHNAKYRMWGTDLLSSAGVQQVAETGNSTILGQEIEACGDDCEPIFRLPCDQMSGTCQAAGTIQVPPTKSRFSMMSMIAPSPDWFVGIHDLELCKFGSWVTKFQAPLRAFDAGTDSGVTYLADNQVTDPALLISLITGDQSVLYNPNDMRINAFGNVTIELVPEQMSMEESVSSEEALSCEGSAVYTITADFVWNANTHPTDYPAGQAHWSPFSGTTHNKNYNMWSPGMLASPGVEQVAETGNNSVLMSEIQECGSDCAPAFAFECDVFSGTCVSSGQVTVQNDNPYLSAVSMIAPSPDWFVGVFDLPLCKFGSWTQEFTTNFFPHDAGTDSGATYLAENEATDPAVPIFRIVNADSVLYNPNEGEILPRGTFSVVLDTVM